LELDLIKFLGEMAEKKKERDLKLTKKQKAFCKNYDECKNATIAALQAGYSGRTAGWRCINNEGVQRELKRIEDEREQDETGSRFVVKQLKGLVRRCTEGRPVTGKDGQVTGTEYDNSNALKALELLGKHLGMFNGKGQRQGAKPGAIVLPERPKDS
jgi:phage terminase small subunit